MGLQHHVIDPSGDTILVVESFERELYLFLLKQNSQSEKWAKIAEILEMDSSEQDRITNCDISLPKTSPPSPLKLATPDPNDPTDMPSPFPSTSESSPEPESNGVQLRVRVSSKHLALASPLLSNWLAESKTALLPDMWREFRGDVSAPLLLLLRVIHGQSRKVPRSVSFEMMYQVAFLANYFGCSEAVEFFADVWIGNARDMWPKHYTIDLSRWIGIAWVFRHRDLFATATCVGICETKAPLPCYESSPVPKKVFDAVGEARQHYLDQILASVYGCVATLSRDEAPTCCSDCASMILGSLIRQLTALRLNPMPEAPYYTLNVSDLLRTLPALQQPSCDVLVHPVNGCQGRCILLPETVELLRTIRMQIEGLDLEEYVDVA